MKTLLLFFCLAPLSLFSQKRKAGIKPGFIVSSGIIAGEAEIKPLYQITGGIVFGRWFTGIGAGYDAYRFNTIPVFADCRVNMGNRKVVFGYAQTGYNFPAGNHHPEVEYAKVRDRLKGGFYADAGIGYRLRLGAGNHLLFSAGYSRLYILQEKAYSYPCGIVPCSNSQFTVYTYRYNFNRVLVKAGWEWGR